MIRQWWILHKVELSLPRDNPPELSLLPSNLPRLRTVKSPRKIIFDHVRLIRSWG